MGNEKPKWLPIGKIKTVRGYIEEALSDTKERLATLEEAVPKPHVMDDALLGRIGAHWGRAHWGHTYGRIGVTPMIKHYVFH